jgi:hypothetical protein
VAGFEKRLETSHDSRPAIGDLFHHLAADGKFIVRDGEPHRLAIRPGGLAQLSDFKSHPRWRLGPIGERVAEHARRLALQDLPAPPRLTLRPVALDLGTDAQIGFIAPARAWTKCAPALDPKTWLEYTRPSTELVVDFLFYAIRLRHVFEKMGFQPSKVQKPALMARFSRSLAYVFRS